MDPAVASAPQGAPDAKAAAATSKGEVKLITLVVLGLVAFGIVLQQFVDPGPVAVVIYTAMMSVTLLVAAYVVRGRVLNSLASFRLAAATLSILALSAALGTLVLQNKPADFYKAEYGAAALFVLGLRLDDLFHNLWFGGLVALMNAGLVTSALRRWPINRRNLGFFSVHLSILVTLAGAGVSAVFSVKGKIDLHVGQTASTVSVTKAGLPTPREVPLGASVQLTRFDVDQWADQPRISLYLPNKKGTNYELKATFENEPGINHRLPEGSAFRIKAYFPDLVMNERLVDGKGDNPALKLTVDGKETFLMPGDRSRVDTQDQVAVLFGWQRPAAKIDAPLHTLAVKDGKAEPVAVRLGGTATLEGGVQVKALRFFPHFTFDIGKKAAMNVSDTPINPALEVEVGGAKRWLFANMPGFGHDKGGPEIVYAFSPEGGSAAATIVAVGGADKSVLVHKPDGTEETLALKEGLDVAGVKLGALLPKASLEREPSSASDQMKKPAVLVELTSKAGTKSEVLMTSEQKEPTRVGKGYLNFVTHVEDVKAFRSEVVVNDGAAKRTEIVAVNSPVSVGPWKLYQVNYDPKDPRYSGLEAVRDPGVSWVFVGFGLLFFGVTYMIYVAPRLRRKEA